MLAKSYLAFFWVVAICIHLFNVVAICDQFYIFIILFFLLSHNSKFFISLFLS